MLSTFVVPPEISAALIALVGAILAGLTAWVRSASPAAKRAATIDDVIARLDDVDAGIKTLDGLARSNHDILLRLLERPR
jgi:hypothetical protein